MCIRDSAGAERRAAWRRSRPQQPGGAQAGHLHRKRGRPTERDHRELPALRAPAQAQAGTPGSGRGCALGAGIRGRRAGPGPDCLGHQAGTRPARGGGGRKSAAPGAAQSGAQREGGDGGERAPSDRGEPGGRRTSAHGAQRQRVRHHARESRQDLRAVLLYQGQGNRPGVGSGPADRQRAWRSHRSRLPSRRWNAVHHSTAGGQGGRAARGDRHGRGGVKSCPSIGQLFSSRAKGSAAGGVKSANLLRGRGAGRDPPLKVSQDGSIHGHVLSPRQVCREPVARNQANRGTTSPKVGQWRGTQAGPRAFRGLACFSLGCGSVDSERRLREVPPMTKTSRPVGLLALCMALAAGAGCQSGSMGATPGGAQDNGLAWDQVNQGYVPRPQAFRVQRILNQYDLPPESLHCQLILCIDAGYGVAPVLVQDRSAVFVQLGFSSGLDPATFRRSPLNLSVVVDRSGSMSGDKLNSVKQALGHLIDQLGASDRLSIVLFDDRVDIWVKPTLVTDPNSLKAAVARIAARGATNMAEGLRAGTSLVQENSGQSGVSDRVMVFTDALTNTGDTDQSTFIQIAASNAAQNIGITLFGVGTDLNQDLVLAITGFRGGNYFFLNDANKIATVFDTDFDYLVTPLAYDLQFQLRPATGFVITAVYGFSAWRCGSTTVEFSIPTVFLSRNHGGIMVRR